MKNISFILALALMIVCVGSDPAVSAKIAVKKKFEGSFLTNVTGTSLSQGPYIQVIRSKAGLDYSLSQFEKLKNRITQLRITSLRKSLASVNYNKNMLVAIFSQPMDNYKLSMENMTMDKGDNVIEVAVNYSHKMSNPRIPPKKSIYYLITVVPKSDFPVILHATELLQKKKGERVSKVITVTGRLMLLSGNDLQLVPVVIKRGNKNSYYITGPKTEELARHIGKVVTLEGSVSHERDGPYEFDLTVSKLVKVF